MSKNYRTCPLCHSKNTLSIEELAVYSTCSKCNRDIEISPYYSGFLSIFLTLLSMVLAEYDYLVLSGLLLIFMVIRHMKLDFLDAFILPLREVRE